jgi:multicomponent Na+:H+ antiporter subunit B
MGSTILTTVTRFMMPLLMMVSIFFLVRGHNAPGGGFIAGLMAASAFSLYCLAFGIEQVRAVLHLQPIAIMAIGLLVSIASGMVSFLCDAPFMTAKWVEFSIPFFGSLNIGTPMIFDVGVCLVVFGMTTSIIIGLAEE